MPFRLAGVPGRSSPAPRLSRLISIRRCLRFLFFLPLLVWAAEKEFCASLVSIFPAPSTRCMPPARPRRRWRTRSTSPCFISTARGISVPNWSMRFPAAGAGLEISLTLKKGARFADGSALSSARRRRHGRLAEKPAFRISVSGRSGFSGKDRGDRPAELAPALEGEIRSLEKLSDLQDTERRRDPGTSTRKSSGSSSPWAADPTAWPP